MASEQFSLCWDNFHKNMSSGMNSLLENEDLVDVTLAVQGKCLKAHKMVLSVCSPYFKELFKSNPCQHPIVFMKDVSYEALSDLLQFMYQGEVQVSQENLTTFIKTAEALQIKGLTGDGNGTTEPEPETAQEHPVHHVEGYKPTPRPKKTAPAPIATSPQVKRQRLSVSSTESQPLPPSITKTEPAPTPSTGTSEAPVQFKMEPYDQSQNLVDETGDDNFGDDTLDDNTVDDSEDYSMMEGGVGEEEPQAGTSTDGAGEGQGRMYILPAKMGHYLMYQDFLFKCVYDNLREGKLYSCFNRQCHSAILFNRAEKKAFLDIDHHHKPTFNGNYDGSQKEVVTLIKNSKVMAEAKSKWFRSGWGKRRRFNVTPEATGTRRNIDFDYY